MENQRGDPKSRILGVPHIVEAETEARRNAQEEWREDLARKTQKKKEEVGLVWGYRV